MTASTAADQYDWFRAIWDALSSTQQDRVRAKAQYEHMTLRAVLIDWPSLVPEHVHSLIPKPERDS